MQKKNQLQVIIQKFATMTHPKALDDLIVYEREKEELNKEFLWRTKKSKNNIKKIT